MVWGGAKALRANGRISRLRGLLQLFSGCRVLEATTTAMKTLSLLSLLAATSAFALSFLNLEAAAIVLAVSGLTAVLGADYGRSFRSLARPLAAAVPAPTSAATERLGLAA